MRRHRTPPDTHAPQTLIESLVELNLRYESLHEEAARMREVRYCSLHGACGRSRPATPATPPQHATSPL